MSLTFKIFATCLFVAFGMVTFWNLNHTFKWFYDLNWFYGVGSALALFGSIYHVHDSVNNDNRSTKSQLVITKFFLFLSLSNLLDETFFNPFEVNWMEYVSALIILIGLTAYVNRIKKNRD